MKRRHSQTAGEQSTTGPPGEDVFVSESIDDRTSTFIGYFSPSIAPKDLQRRSDIKAASHRMLAWRRRSSSQRTIAGQRPLETGYDDDGEKYGGKRVLSVLETMKVEGSLVVARWYGGVMLGPVRFTHMENCAREAVQAWQQSQAAAAEEKAQVEAEAKETARLVEELQERDSSIAALRSLLASKSKREESAAALNESKLLSPKQQAIDYASLPLQRLRALDKARDSTIAFLLKQIDAAEARIREAANGGRAERDVGGQDGISTHDHEQTTTLPHDPEPP